MNIVKVEQAYTKEESAIAKAKIEDFVNEVKNGTYIKYDEDRVLYNIYTNEKNTLVGWRGSKEKAEWFSQALRSIKVQQCPRKCPNHVRLILDEFANIGQIPDFDQKLATIRKYEISCSIILQAISQLKDLYEKKWNTIAANCDSKLFLGCDDLDTIEWLLKMLGKKTTVVENTSWQAKGEGSTSYNRSSIELLTIDQVTMMADDECIVRVRGERPYYGKKYELTEHPNYEYAKSVKGKFEIPPSNMMPGTDERGPLRNRKRNVTASADTMSTAFTPENKPESTHSTPDVTPSTDIPMDNPLPEGFVDDLALITPAKTPSVPKSREMKDALRKAKNAMNKKGAKEANDSLEHLDEHVAIEALDSLNDGFAAIFGVSAGASQEDIKEAVESVVLLEQPPDDAFAYAMTE